LLDRLLACPEKLRQQRRAARHPRRNVIAVSHVAERAQREIVHEGIMVHCNPLSHSSNQSDILVSCPTRSNFSHAARELIWPVRVNRFLCRPGFRTCLAPHSFAGLGTGKVFSHRMKKVFTCPIFMPWITRKRKKRRNELKRRISPSH